MNSHRVRASTRIPKSNWSKPTPPCHRSVLMTSVSAFVCGRDSLHVHGTIGAKGIDGNRTLLPFLDGNSLFLSL